MSNNPLPIVHPRILAVRLNIMPGFMEFKFLSLLLVQQKNPGGESGPRRPQQPSMATPGRLIIG